MHQIDSFEISLAPAPINPDTRILSTKGAGAAPSLEALRERERRLGLLPEQEEISDRYLSLFTAREDEPLAPAAKSAQHAQAAVSFATFDA